MGWWVESRSESLSHPVPHELIFRCPNPFRAPTQSRLLSSGTMLFLGDDKIVFRWSSQKLFLLPQQQIRNSVLEIHASENMLGARKGGSIFKGMCVRATPVSAGHEGVQSPGNRRRQEIRSQHQFSMLLKTVSRSFHQVLLRVYCWRGPWGQDYSVLGGTKD